MKAILRTPLLVAALSLPGHAKDQRPMPNPQIDYAGFLMDAATVGQVRELNRLTEEEFRRMMTGPRTLVDDARSDDECRLLQIKSAKHLGLTDVVRAESPSCESLGSVTIK